jgi:hypothetical protein
VVMTCVQYIYQMRFISCVWINLRQLRGAHDRYFRVL